MRNVFTAKSSYFHFFSTLFYVVFFVFALIYTVGISEMFKGFFLLLLLVHIYLPIHVLLFLYKEFSINDDKNLIISYPYNIKKSIVIPLKEIKKVHYGVGYGAQWFELTVQSEFDNVAVQTFSIDLKKKGRIQLLKLFKLTGIIISGEIE